ncbi:MAG: TrmH family RNA methyltransferase, partial [Nanoarchaeota archaeon]
YENIHKISMMEFLDITKENNRNVVVAERRPTLSTKTLYSLKYPDNPILFFGCERFGVPDCILNEFPENIVSIPQYGILHDFNLAGTVSMFLYDWISKRYRQ